LNQKDIFSIIRNTPGPAAGIMRDAGTPLTGLNFHAPWPITKQSQAQPAGLPGARPF
jgi:hypothetical protein